jgi:hypothetical protein
LFGGGDKTIAGPKYFIDARQRLCPISQCRNSLRAADTRYVTHAQKMRRSQHFFVRLGANHHDALRSCNLRWNNGHQQRGNQSESAAGYIAPDGFDRPHQLRDFDAGFHFQPPRARQLLFGNTANISRGMSDGAAKFRRCL